MKLNGAKFAKHVGRMADLLPPGTKMIVLLFDDEEGVLSLSRTPHHEILELVKLWVTARSEELQEASKKYEN